MKETMEQFIEKIMERWGVESVGGFLLILFIFAITGITTLYVRQLAFGWLGFSDMTPLWIEVVAWILVVFPSYQILFLLYGFILGRFEFVWNFEKKSLRRIKRLFVRKGH